MKREGAPPREGVPSLSMCSLLVFIRGFGGVLGAFGPLVRLFKLFLKKFWEAYPALTRGFSVLFRSE